MNNVYKEGSVWRISFVKVQPGKGNLYLLEVGPARKKIMDAAIKNGTVLSYKTLNGLSMGHSDWDFMFMVEYKNWAAIDNMQQKLDELSSKFIGGDETVLEIVDQRCAVREVIGEKFMREIIFT